ncbi:ARM repeat superfamily protein [Tasmannia lanceolata]|uniref:ARM repeat superfamily protein n=1 Tax=Tasmannia lanceolata TaxID=3420 RepID=UPI004064BAFE
MKTHPKLKTPPRPLFSCGIFGNCTQSVLSPTTPQTPTLPGPNPPQPDPNPLHPGPNPQPPSSSSSSSSTSQSFTQWRFPPFHHHQPPSQSDPIPNPSSDPNPTQSNPPKLPPSTNLAELFHVAELQLSSTSSPTRLSALNLLEQSLVPDPDSGTGCPPAVMAGVVGFLKVAPAARAATKVLLALCLAEENRHVAVAAGAVPAVVEAVPELDGPAAERGLAVLELLYMVEEGAEELRAHALVVPMLVEMLGKMEGRGKECAISVLAAIFSGGNGRLEVVPPVVAGAVVVALQGECSARGRRKGAQLLKLVHDNGRMDLSEEGR